MFTLGTLVLAETLYLKTVVWHDAFSAISGSAVGCAFAAVYWWLAPSVSHALASPNPTS